MGWQFLIGVWSVSSEDGRRKVSIFERIDEVDGCEVVFEALKRYFPLFILTKRVTPAELVSEDIKMKWGMSLFCAKLGQSNDIACFQGFSDFLNSYLRLLGCHLISLSVRLALEFYFFRRHAC